MGVLTTNVVARDTELSQHCAGSNSLCVFDKQFSIVCMLSVGNPYIGNPYIVFWVLWFSICPQLVIHTVYSGCYGLFSATVGNPFIAFWVLWFILCQQSVIHTLYSGCYGLVSAHSW